MNYDPNSDSGRILERAGEILAGERLNDDGEPRYEWRKPNRLELLVGGVIAVGFLAFLAFLFLV